MGRLSLVRIAVLLLGIATLAGCFDPKVVGSNCDDRTILFPGKFDSPPPEFRFELFQGSALDANGVNDRQDYWIWGGDENNVNDGDVVRARWKTLQTTINLGENPPATCDLCVTGCGFTVNPGEFSQVVLKESFDSGGMAAPIRTFYLNAGCPVLGQNPDPTRTIGDTSFRPDKSALYEMSYISGSCENRGDVLASNKMFVVHNNSQAPVEYPAEFFEPTKIRVVIPATDSFSPRLRVSRVELLEGAYGTDPASGRFKISGGTLKLKAVWPGTTPVVGNLQIPADSDGNIDLTVAVPNRLPFVTTPAYTTAADTSRLIWFLEVDGSTPFDTTKNYAARFTLVPR